MPFHVICLETGSPVFDATGALPMIFEAGYQAASAARDYSAQTGKKYQPRPIAGEEWRQREQARFDSGEYQPLPWRNMAWFLNSEACRNHYAHVSTERDGMVAFTESPEKGVADRQTRQRPGTYLQRFYADVLSADEIQKLARDYAGRFEDNVLLLANTADEIERVYVEGPRSCMSGKPSEYSSPFHPVRVYAAGDLAVAYVMRGGSIVGRALCWPQEKKHSRIYGDEDRLGPLLRAAGYRSGSLRGARLLRERANGGGFVCPYIDHDFSVEDRGDFLHISGDIRAENTNGLIDIEEGEYCPHCEERSDPDDFYYMEDLGESWCESCADNDAFVCARTGERFGRRRSVTLMANGDYWSNDEFENHGFTCDATGENHHMDDAVHVDGGTWCQSHFDDHGFQCHGCSDCFSNDDGQEVDGDWYCVDCAPEPDEPESIEPRELTARRHIPRQGRDMLPGQMEMDLPQAARFQVGDVVSLADNDVAARVCRWRHAQRTGYPRWTFQTRLLILRVHDEYGNIQFAIDGTNTLSTETWSANAFKLIQRGN